MGVYVNTKGKSTAHTTGTECRFYQVQDQLQACVPWLNQAVEIPEHEKWRDTHLVLHAD